MSCMDLATIGSHHAADGIYYIDRGMFPKLSMCGAWQHYLESMRLLDTGRAPITLELLTLGSYQAGRPDSAFIRERLAPWAPSWHFHARELHYRWSRAREDFLRRAARHCMDFLAVRAIAEGRLPESALPCYAGAGEDLERGRRYIASLCERLEFRA